MSNQYDVLSTPRDESKDASSIQSQKDDMKQQAYAARAGVKAKAADLKEQVVNSGVLSSVQSQLQSGLELAKSKVTELTGVDLAGKSAEQAVEELEEVAGEEWSTVKRKGAKRAEEAVDANLNPQQKAKLAKGIKQAKQAGRAGLAQANEQVGGLFNTMFAAPQLRPLKNFIVKNNLQTPAMVLMALGSLWLGLSLIRLVASFATPAVPEFDIHSAEASKAWLKYHAGDYQGRAIDAKDSLTGRIATFLANHELGKLGLDSDKLRAAAIDWKDIGMSKLGLHEPTMSEQVWSWVTGRPLTWQDRVMSVLSLGKKGLKAAAAMNPGMKAAKMAANGLKNSAKDKLGLHEPTLSERIVDGVKNVIPGLKAHVVAPEPTLLERAQGVVHDGIDSIRSHLPGSAEAEAAKARAYAATHASTLDNIKSGAEYVKNRVIHGAQEAAHIAQDRANRIHDEAKYKTGL